MTKDIDLKAIDELIYEVEMFEQAGVYPIQDFIDNLKTLAAKVKEETKLEGCVVVPVNNTTIVAIEKMVEQQVEASGITEDVFRLDGVKILNAAVEAARGGNHD